MASIHVGNLARATTEDTLRKVFSEHGQVSDVNIIKDRETGQPRGFAFIEMPDGAAAAKAIKELNLREVDGRAITVIEARPKSDRPRRGGGGGPRRYR